MLDLLRVVLTPRYHHVCTKGRPLGLCWRQAAATHLCWLSWGALMLPADVRGHGVRAHIRQESCLVSMSQRHMLSAADQAQPSGARAGRQVPLSALKWQQQHLASSCPGVTLLDHSSDPELQVRLGMASCSLHCCMHFAGVCMSSERYFLKPSSSCQVIPDRGHKPCRLLW